MASNAESVLREALTLPETDRAHLAAELLASIDDQGEEWSLDLADEYARELERRVERVVSGESSGIDFETAQQKLDDELAGG